MSGADARSMSSTCRAGLDTAATSTTDPAPQLPGADDVSEAPVGHQGAGAVALVTELGRRFRAGDLDAAFALYHPDLRIDQPGSLPHGGTHRGREGAEAMAAMFSRHWDRTIGEARLMGSGEVAVQVTTQTWTAGSTGRSATVDVVELFAVAEGLITAIRVFPQDTHRLLGTLDTSGPPDRKEGDARA
jgi:uncharacterized protein